MKYGALFMSRFAAVWLALIAATLLSVLLIERYASTSLDRFAGAGVIVIAFLKVRWVGLDFMELRHAPVKLRAAFEIWVVAMAAILLVIYLRAMTGV